MSGSSRLDHRDRVFRPRGRPIERIAQAVERTDGLINIVGVERAEIDFFPSSLQIDLGVLPVGTYRIELALRVRNADGTLGPETLRSAFDLVVGEVSRPCTPASIVADAYYLGTRVGTGFASPLSVRVFDKQQRPVPGAVVYFSRIARPEEAIAPDLPTPDAALDSTSATTDANGISQSPPLRTASAGAIRSWLVMCVAMTFASATKGTQPLRETDVSGGRPKALRIHPAPSPVPL